jgi:aryl-alcohol dehydrogenase
MAGRQSFALITPRTFAPLGCGLQTGAGTVLNVLKVHPGSSITVIGVGAVGLAALMAAKIAQARTIFAVDIH